MGAFCESMLLGASDLLEQIRIHPFIVQTANGTIPPGTFRRFTTQNYLRLREFERFLASLSARAPETVRDRFNKAMFQNHSDIELYEELAAKLDVNLAKARMTYACHSSVCFLHATANMRSFEEAIAALYGTELALHIGWTHARAHQSAPNTWQEFIDLWGGEGIAHWVESLAAIIDSISPEVSQKCKEMMTESFRAALGYRIRFWDMAFQEVDW